MSQKFSILSLACLPLLACGGDDANNKKIVVPDTKVFMDGSGGGSCAVQPMYAALGNLGAVVDHPMNSAHDEFMQLYTSLGSNDATLAILIAGGTKWPTGITGGSGSAPVTIDSTDGDYSMCDLCFFASVGGFDMTAMTLGIKDTSDVYLANAGSMMIQQKGVNGGSAGSGSNYFFASVSGLHLHHVSLDTSAGTSTDITDGCTTAIGSGDYGYIPAAGSAAFTMPVKVIDGSHMTQQEKMDLKRDLVLGRRHI